MEASLATVKAGLAYAWLPDHVVAESLQNGSLKALPLVTGRERRVPLYLVLVRAEVAGPAARAAVECFQRHVPVTARATAGVPGAVGTAGMTGATGGGEPARTSGAPGAMGPAEATGVAGTAGSAGVADATGPRLAHE
jgi:hypothetical protein